MIYLSYGRHKPSNSEISHLLGTSSTPLLTPSSPPSFIPHDRHSRQPYIAEKESIIEKKKESTKEGIYEGRNLRRKESTKEGIYEGRNLRRKESTKEGIYEKESIYDKKESTKKSIYEKESIYEKDSIYGGIHLQGNPSTGESIYNKQLRERIHNLEL
jgi:hypothetical protein